MCALVAVCGFASCDEELEPWETVSLEASCSQEELLPYDGGTFTVSVDANTDWTATAPEWMTLNKVSGTGPGTISVTVGENNGAKKRYGTIIITAGDDEPQGNVVGRKTSSVSISQTPLAEVIDPASTVTVNSVETDLLCQYEDGWEELGFSNFYYISGTITWSVETQYTDEFIKAAFGDNDVTMEVAFMSSEDQVLDTHVFNFGALAFSAGSHTYELDPYDLQSIRLYVDEIPAKCMIRFYTYGKSGNVVNLFSSEEPYSIRYFHPY